MFFADNCYEFNYIFYRNMINSLERLKQVLSENRYDLAFIVGNGINRFAYGCIRDVSWNGLLLEVWQQISYRTMSDISSGISLTEFYDIMEMEAGSIDKVRQKVVDLLGEWRPDEYHKWLQEKISSDWDVPLLTTNFDMNLNEGLTLNKLESENLKFTDYYPWNVYFSRTELNSPTEGFGVWHINGMLKYKRSIRLGLSEYMSLSSRVRTFLHKEDGLDDFDLKNQNRWKGYPTWLHIIFNKSLCIFGLALDENETFLRWLLIERAKYFKRYPERKKKGWFVCKAGECSEGKRLYLDYIGFELVQLDSYDDIYRGIFLP